MTGKILPENDPDLKLARRFGKYLEGESTLSEKDDPLMRVLAAYKEDRQQDTRGVDDTDIQSDKIWAKISGATRPAKNSAAIHQLGQSKNNIRTIRAIAASLLIAAFIGFAAYFYLNRQPEMLASTSATIQTLTLEDGSRVTLRPYSSIEALTINATEHSYKLKGEAYFEVVKRSGRTFSVRAGNGKVRVLGTKFDLSNWGDQTQVYLEEGAISFQNLETDNTVTLSPGQAAAIGPDNQINTTAADIIEYTDWMKRELTFRNKTAGYVFNEMEQEYDIAITAPDSVLNMRLSGSLSLGKISESLQDLSLVLDGQFVKEGENSYTFVPEK